MPSALNHHANAGLYDENFVGNDIQHLQAASPTFHDERKRDDRFSVQGSDIHGRTLLDKMDSEDRTKRNQDLDNTHTFKDSNMNLQDHSDGLLNSRG